MAINSSQEAPSFMYDSLGGDARLKPQFQSIFVNSRPQVSRVDELLNAARERLGNARGAADMRRRTQEEQGVRSYVPANPEAAGEELLKRVYSSKLPMMSEFTPTQLQQRPTGGVIASYGPNERVVTSRYGTGTATAPTGKPATFDGMSKEKFFGQAAARQGMDNAFARAENTGRTDKKTGNPIFASKQIPKGSDAGTERVFEAMKKRKAA
jgi:hypothetical protein